MISRERFVELAERFSKARAKDNKALETILDVISNGHSVPSFGNVVEDVFIDLLAESVVNEDCSFQDAKDLIHYFYYEACDCSTGNLRPGAGKLWAYGIDDKHYEIQETGWGDIYDEITDWVGYFKSKTGVEPRPAETATDNNGDK